jgi:hypothetical protein
VGQVGQVGRAIRIACLAFPAALRSCFALKEISRACRGPRFPSHISSAKKLNITDPPIIAVVGKAFSTLATLRNANTTFGQAKSAVPSQFLTAMCAAIRNGHRTLGVSRAILCDSACDTLDITVSQIFPVRKSIERLPRPLQMKHRKLICLSGSGANNDVDWGFRSE